MRGLRSLSVAAVIGTTLALVVDVILQSALALVRVDGGGSGLLEATLLERGRWVLVAGLIWIAAPWVDAAIVDDTQSAAAPAGISRRTGLRTAGIAMLAVPIIWALATIGLRALSITLSGDWPYEGRIFLTGYFYSSLFISYAPWALAGAGVIGLARHAVDDDAE
jgi:hypothetical protein